VFLRMTHASVKLNLHILWFPLRALWEKRIREMEAIKLLCRFPER